MKAVRPFVLAVAASALGLACDRWPTAPSDPPPCSAAACDSVAQASDPAVGSASNVAAQAQFSNYAVAW